MCLVSVVKVKMRHFREPGEVELRLHVTDNNYWAPQRWDSG
jgi:hypothetical protein